MKQITQTLVCLFFLSAIAHAGNPVPFINNPLVPTSVAPGTGALTLTVNGGGFVKGSTVNWNGTPLETKFVSNTKLTASIPATDTLRAGSSEITVTNPRTGTASNLEQFLVATSGSNVFYGNAPNSPYGNYLSPSGLWDFTGGGKLDLLAFSWVPQFSGVMAGSGNGTFGSPSNSLAQGYRAWVVGDFNKDGKLDLLGYDGNTASWPPSGTFQLFWGVGDETFSPGPTVPVPSGFLVTGQMASNAVPAATTYDVNGDGNLDLFILNPTVDPHVIQVLWGKGDGAFSAGPSTTLPRGFGLVAIADFNGDGKLDLLLKSGVNTKGASFEVLLGNGDGVFTPATGGPINGGPAASNVVVADFNGDEKLDLAIPDGVYGAPTPAGGLDTPPVAILLGNGDGTFTRVPNCCGTPGQQAYNVVAADLNNDGQLDLAVSIANNLGSFRVDPVSYPPVYIETFLGDSHGTFKPTDYSLLLPSQNPLSAGDGTMGLYAADLNSDGKLDFVTGDIFNSGAAGYEISVLLQTPPVQLPDFTIAPANAAVSVKAGAPATGNIQITSIYGFLRDGISLTLTGCPTNAACNVEQPHGMIIPTSTGSFPLTAVTQACTAVGTLPPSPIDQQPGPCTGGTPTGNYTITIAGTSGSVTHSTSFTLVVQ